MEMFDKKRRQPEEPKREPAAMQEQMAGRQSAPQPTAKDGIMQAQRMQGMGGAPEVPAQRLGGAMDGFRALKQVIGREQIREARQTLMRYKEGKANLERKVIESEQW